MNFNQNNNKPLSDRTDDVAIENITSDAFYKVNKHQSYKLITLLVLILVTTRFGYLFSLPPTNISTFWPPNAILLAFLLSVPFHVWRSFIMYSFITYILAEYWIGFPIATSIAFALFNCITVATAAYFIKHRTIINKESLFNISLFNFFLITSVASFIAGFLGASYLYVLSIDENINYLVIWQRWAFADFVGYLLFAPIIYLILITSRQDMHYLSHKIWKKALLIFSVLILSCLVIDVVGIYTDGKYGVLFFMPIPIVLWATFSFQVFGGILAMLIYTLVLKISIIYGLAPFPHLTIEETVISLQLFIIINTFIVLFVAELIKQKDYFEKDSLIDGLTKVGNYRYYHQTFNQYWHMAMRENVPITIITIDIDYFKKYNDLYGHPEGDECLRKLSNIIQKTMTRANDLVARIGGEEFSCFLYNADKSKAIIMVKKLMFEINNLNLPHETSDISDRVTVSIGFKSVVPDNKMIFIDFIKEVDHLLYDAKQKGRNNWVSD